jgi:AcrR family transcriptional regulator
MYDERGTDVSLEEVARHAGLGVATIYRHFPSQEALLEAMLSDRFIALGSRARELAGQEDSDAALVDWLHAYITHSTRYRGLALSIMSGLRDQDSPLAASCSAMQDGGAELLARAQLDGRIRADLDMADLLRLVTAVAVTAGPQPREAARLLDLLLDGLRPRDPAA